MKNIQLAVISFCMVMGVEVIGYAQNSTVKGGRTFVGGTIDMSTSTVTIVNRVMTGVDPTGTCPNTGETVFNSSTSKYWICNVNWAQIVGTGGGGGTATVNGALVATDTGVVNAYAGCPIGVTTGTQPTDGMMVELRVLNVNTSTTPTFKYCNTSALSIVFPDGSNLNVGTINTYTTYTNLLVYHSASTKWEFVTSPRPATVGAGGECETGTDNTGKTFATPDCITIAINKLAPLAGVTPFTNQWITWTGAAYLGAWNPTTGISGRVVRWWKPDGSTTIQAGGNQGTASGCGTNVVVNPTSTTGLGVKLSAPDANNNSTCFVSNAAVPSLYAGSNIIFWAYVAIPDVTAMSYILGVVGSGYSQNATALAYTSGDYTAPLTMFRFNTGASDASTWKCTSTASGTSPVVANSNVTVDTNPHHFIITTDNLTEHYYIDGVEVCTGTAWGPALPAASTMTPYIGLKQLAAKSGAEGITMYGVSTEADR